MSRTRIVLDRLDERIVPAYGLDPTYGASGLVLDDTTAASQAFYATASYPLSDGSLYVAGSYVASNGGNRVPAVMLLHNGGNVNTNFNGGTPASVPSITVYDPSSVKMAVQSDGKILIANSTQGVNGIDIAVSRLNTDGSVDTSFASNGTQILGLNIDGTTSDALVDLKVLTGGKIAVLGTATTGSNLGGNQQDVTVTMLASDGTINTSFGTGGTTRINLGNSTAVNDKAAGLASLSNGSLVIGVNQYDPSTHALTGNYLVSLTSTGALNSNFNSNGVLPLNISSGANRADQIVSVAMDSNNNIVVLGKDYATSVVGVTGTAVPSQFVVANVQSNGTMNSTFGSKGVTTIAFNNAAGNPVTENTPTSLQVNADGSILVAGSTRTQEVQSGNTYAANDFAVAKLTSAGAPDTSFGTNGQMVVRFDPKNSTSANDSTNDTAAAISVTTNGSIYLVGNSSSPLGDGNTSLAVARLSASATTPPTTTPPTTTPPTTTPPTTTPPTTTPPTTSPPTTVVQPSIWKPNSSDRIFPTIPNSLVANAQADFNGDGIADYVFYTTGGDAVARVIDGKTGNPITGIWRPYESNYKNGLNVAVGDVNNDGKSDIVFSPAYGGSARIQVFSMASGGPTLLANYYGIGDPTYRGGATVAVGDFNGSGYGDVAVGAGFGGGPRIAIWDGQTVSKGAPTELANEFFAIPDVAFRGGVTLAAGNYDGSGAADLAIGMGAGGGPRVLVIKGSALTSGDPSSGVISDFFARGNTASRSGISVSTMINPADGSEQLVTTDAFGQIVYTDGTSNGTPLKAAVSPPVTLPGPPRARLVGL